ncbi:hypothetical protein EVAR_76546_1 [Eumeta japonica]|uniref:BESS domain-containing protein n=1 Tax=Eumeta variegata TaxID=151549 RepID=A0A4C1T561_EUMVA|nr:hypothetical protein EVAR_76546_1 [Eumeta japonica]
MVTLIFFETLRRTAHPRPRREAGDGNGEASPATAVRHVRTGRCQTLRENTEGVDLGSPRHPPLSGLRHRGARRQGNILRYKLVADDMKLQQTTCRSDTTGEECKKKWRSLRDNYQRFKEKSKLGTGSAALIKSKQNRHLQLSFLDNVPHHRAGEADTKNMVRRMNDDIDLFCRHIGEVLRNLSLYEKEKAKKRLREVLSDYEIMAASHLSGRNTFSSPSNSTSNDRASTSSELYTPSPRHNQHCIRSYSPFGTTTVSPELAEQGNARGDFHLDAYSPISTATASPGPSGITNGLG